MYGVNNWKLASKGRITLWGILALWLSLCFAAKGSQSVTLAWNVIPSSTNAGYILYYGTSSRNYDTRVDVGPNTHFTAVDLTEGLTYYFAVTAYNAAKLESPPSSEIVYLVPGILALGQGLNSVRLLNMQFPAAPGHWYELQASVDLKSWINIWQTATSTSNAWVGFQDPQRSRFPKRFYRLASHVSSALPPPVIQTETQTGANVALAWNALAGQTYQVQYSSSPASADWSNLGNVVTAANSTGSAAYLVGSGSQWNYRVVLATLPPPVFQSVAKKNGRITLTCSTVAGQMYQLQYSRSLMQPNWQNLGSAITAFSSTMTASDVIGADPQRFYRAVLVGSLPPPAFQSVIQSNHKIVFTWNTVAGQMYQVEYTPSLAQPNWQNLGDAITALSSTATASDAIGPDPQRFYRVIHLASFPSPVIQSVTQANGRIMFTWNTIAGQTYQVQSTSSLAQPNWTNLGGAITASGSTTTASDVIVPHSQRFYRVVWSN